MSDDAYHAFSIPNLYHWLKNKYTNCLNFEHTIFLTEHIVDALLNNAGFTIIKKSNYKSHSIFYLCKKQKCEFKKIPNNYNEYKSLFIDYINYNLDIVSNINFNIKNTQTPVYLFGAHIFSQALLTFGLDSEKILAIIDNSKLKYKKRLYGTTFVVDSPDILKSEESPLVILKAGVYTEEIKAGILNNINPSTTFI